MVGDLQTCWTPGLGINPQEVLRVPEIQAASPFFWSTLPSQSQGPPSASWLLAPTRSQNALLPPLCPSWLEPELRILHATPLSVQSPPAFHSFPVSVC